MTDIDVNYLSEAINDKMDRDGHNVESPSAVMIDSYVNGSSGYRIWSDGYCVQWGELTKSTSGTLTFVKKYRIKPQVYIGGSSQKGASSYDNESMPTTITTNGFTYNNVLASSAEVYPFWKACGYLAEGEY